VVDVVTDRAGFLDWVFANLGVDVMGCGDECPFIPGKRYLDTPSSCTRIRQSWRAYRRPRTRRGEGGTPITCHQQPSRRPIEGEHINRL
jgi:hypothetical protein